MKKAGTGEIKQKEPLEPEDIETLYNSDAFSIDTPSGLQNKVIFEYLYFFCNRGRENLREVKTDDFKVCVDSTGKKYVEVCTKKQTKNHRGDDVTDVDKKEGRMYEKTGN